MRVADIFRLHVCCAWVVPRGSGGRSSEPLSRIRVAPQGARRQRLGAPRLGQRGNLDCPYETLTVEGERSQTTPDAALGATGSRDLTHCTDFEGKVPDARPTSRLGCLPQERSVADRHVGRLGQPDEFEQTASTIGKWRNSDSRLFRMPLTFILSTSPFVAKLTEAKARRAVSWSDVQPIR